MTAVPEFFERFPITSIASPDLTAALESPGEHALTILFLWGYKCPNCDVAKRAMLLHQEKLAWANIRWLHCNVYDDPEMATRFSLHGVPVFIVFRSTKSPGRITGWPGIAAFTTAIEKQLTLTTQQP